MTLPVKKAQFWSDFDGTAVEKYGYKSARNWLKYPLPAIPNYLDFINGVQATGVELAGVVTIRKEAVRRIVTNRSLKKLGYISTIKPNQVVYAGSEEVKAWFVAEQSRQGPVGMIDDKPHKFGGALLEALAELSSHDDHLQPILLGAVYGPDNQKNIEQLAEKAKRLPLDGLEVKETGPITAIGLNVRAENLSLDVVQLLPYSFQTGQDFGQAVQSLPSID